MLGKWGKKIKGQFKWIQGIFHALLKHIPKWIIPVICTILVLLANYIAPSLILSLAGVSALLFIFSIDFFKKWPALYLIFAIGILVWSNFYFAEGGLHPSCSRRMRSYLTNETKMRDDDGDGFSVQCEDMGHSLPNDSTSIPDFDDLEPLAPSFGEQFNSNNCVFKPKDNAFDFYHAGLKSKSILNYKFSIKIKNYKFSPDGGSFNCPVTAEDKLKNRMHCEISNDNFRKNFEAIKGDFDLQILAIPDDESEPEPFNLKCVKK